MPPRAAKKSPAGPKKPRKPLAVKPKTKASSIVVEDEKVPEVKIETSSGVEEVSPTVEEVSPTVEEALLTAEEVLPTVEEALPTVEAVLPTVEVVLPPIVEEEEIVKEEVTDSVVKESMEIGVTAVEESVKIEVTVVEESTEVREVDISMAEELVVSADPVSDAADVGKNGEIIEKENDDTNVNDGAQMDLEAAVLGSKHDQVEEETGVGEAEETEAGEDDLADVDDDGDSVEDGEDGNAGVGDCGDRGGEDDDAGDDNGGDDRVEDGDKNESGDDEDEENEEEDPSEYMHAPFTERKKQKEFEIFVGGLDKEAVEDDLIKVFGEFGEIQAARIVKHPVTQKSKGFAFIRYATAEQANKALTELKDGTEVRGKRVGISASQDKDTLYVGNICKTWTKDHVLETLKGFGIDQLEEVILPDDPKNEGKSKGFAFLEFGSHADAMAAFQRLRKPDAVLGRDRSAKVAFAQPSNPSEEALAQVKTVYVEGLPDSWDEEQLKEQCKQYGEIKKVQLSRNFTSTKRKDFGFVAFTSRESAIACVEGINTAQLGDGEIKVKANLAKPQNKGRLAKQAARGGFKVNKDGIAEEVGVSKMKGRAKAAEGKGKVKVNSKSKSAKGGKQSQFQGVVAEGQGGGPSRPQRTEFHQKKGQPFNNGKRGRRGGETDSRSRPSKKARNNRTFASGNGRGRPNSGFGNQRNPHYGKSRANYAAYPAAPRGPYAAGYAAPTPSYQGHTYGAVSGPKRNHSDMEPHAGYIQPVAKQGRDPYGYGQASSAGYGSQGTSSANYGGVPAVAPSYAPEYSSYAGAGYEGGYVYPNTGAYAPRRPYY